MARDNGRELAVAICRAFGLDPCMVREFHFHATANGDTYVEVLMFPAPSTGADEPIFAKYQLVPMEEGQDG